MNKLKVALIFFVFLSTRVFASGIPTVDAAAITQMVNQILEMQKQYKQMQKDYEQYTKMNHNMSGISGNGNIFNEDAINDLFHNYEEAIDNVIKMGAEGLEGEAKKIFDIKDLGARCKTLAPTAKDLCEKDAALTAVMEASYKKSLDTIERRRDNINKLLKQTLQAQSQKQIADLQVRMQGEVAFLQAQQIKAEATFNYINAQQEAVKLQHQKFMHNLTDTTGLTVEEAFQ